MPQRSIVSNFDSRVAKTRQLYSTLKYLFKKEKNNFHLSTYSFLFDSKLPKRGKGGKKKKNATFLYFGLKMVYFLEKLSNIYFLPNTDIANK
jgi:hypothetical protein